MHVSLIAVSSLDGCITRHDEPGAGFASEYDAAHFRQAIRSCDCSVFGSQTWERDVEPIMAEVEEDPSRLRLVMTSRVDAYRAAVRPGTVEFTDAQPVEVVADLATRGYERCALLGGGKIYSAFLGAGLVDEILLTVEPVVFGSGIRLAVNPLDCRFEFSSVTQLGPSTLLLRYVRLDGHDSGRA